MKKGELISVAKNMVTEYFNKYVDKNKTKGIQKINFDDVEVIGFYKKGKNYRLLLVTPTSDGIYYEVSYDSKTDKIYSYAYKKVRSRKTTEDKYFRDYKYYSKNR
jgi:hypothetical protein